MKTYRTEYDWIVKGRMLKPNELCSAHAIGGDYLYEKLQTIRFVAKNVTFDPTEVMRCRPLGDIRELFKLNS